MNEETKKAIEESIAHWKRMIDWAKKQNPMLIVFESKMLKEINEAWHSNDCSLCTLFYDFKSIRSECKNCPLKLKGYKCESFSCSRSFSPWSKVNMSSTWGEWTENAKEFLKILEGFKDERF